MLALCFVCSTVYSPSVFSEEMFVHYKEESKEFLISEEKLEDIQKEMQWLLEEMEVTIATRHEMKLNKAPGIVTIITAEEIRNSGYRTFAGILRTVPGFEIFKNSEFGDMDTAVRGLKGANKIRVMLNGHLINNPLRGEAFVSFDHFPSAFVSGTRLREKDDERDDLPAFALLNLSVIGKEFFNTMEIQGTIFNLLDKDYSDPRPRFHRGRSAQAGANVLRWAELSVLSEIHHFTVNVSVDY